jgi:hypothetical protein
VKSKKGAVRKSRAGHDGSIYRRNGRWYIEGVNKIFYSRQAARDYKNYQYIPKTPPPAYRPEVFFKLLGPNRVPVFQKNRLERALKLARDPKDEKDIKHQLLELPWPPSGTMTKTIKDVEPCERGYHLIPANLRSLCFFLDQTDHNYSPTQPTYLSGPGTVLWAVRVPKDAELERHEKGSQEFKVVVSQAELVCQICTWQDGMTLEEFKYAAVKAVLTYCKFEGKALAAYSQ